jgi:plastocyanin
MKCRVRTVIGGLLLVTLVAACGGTPDEASAVQPPTAPSSAPTYNWPLTATITLTPNGPQPAQVIINVGGRVTFVNSDARAHEMVSDPEQRHDECPSINRVGFLSPGQKGETAVFETVRACGFHDHLDPTGVVGRIEVRIE